MEAGGLYLGQDPLPPPLLAVGFAPALGPSGVNNACSCGFRSSLTVPSCCLLHFKIFLLFFFFS